MLGEDTPAIGIDLAEGDGSHSGALKAKREAADSAEEVKDVHPPTRSPSDALATAGLNGLAKQISAIVNIAMHYEHHCYQASTKKTPDPRSLW